MKKLMYQLIGMLVLCLAAAALNAQQDRNLPWDIWKKPTTQSFTEIQAEAEAYFATRDQGRGSGYKQWKRWEEFNSTRLDASGNIVNRAPILYAEYQKAIKKQQGEIDNPRQRNIMGDWKEWSATNYVRQGSWSPGIGRINVIAYHPTDPNIIYAGTPAGGLFRTTNNGGTWACLTDKLASIGVSGIAINPENPSSIYILTGDGDGGDTRSIGVYKSTNSGADWNPTGLVWNTGQNILGYKLVMEPGDTTYLIAVTDNGIYRTTNSGTSWTQVQTGTFFDVEYKPGSPSRVYATSASSIWTSNNWGGTWTAGYNPAGITDRIQIAVSANAPGDVYLLAGPSVSASQHRGVHKSTDSGVNFNLQSSSPNILGSAFLGNGTGDQSTYDLAIAASPANSSTIVTGGINIWRSTNNGTTMNQSSHWFFNVLDTTSIPIDYAHADIHHLSYNPLNNRLYAGTDGGIFFSDDNGLTWTDITSGLAISQIYHFAGTDQDINYMVAGMQDNGSSILEPDTMRVVLGADGGDAMIDPRNKNVSYAMQQRGNLRKTINGWVDSLHIKPTNGNGPFITRYGMDMNNPDTIYAGWTNENMYRSYDGGQNWTFLNVGNQNSNIRSISVSTNSSTLYACSSCAAYRSTDNGANWTTILFVGVGNPCDITSVTAAAGNPNTCIITRGGFNTNPKVWSSTNGATATTINNGLFNFTDFLPPVPVNTAAIASTDIGRLYVGTDLGVYYIDLFDVLNGGWKMFNKNLPNVPVTDFEIYEQEGIMRIATYGRGVWQSDLFNTCNYNLTLTQANDPFFGVPIGVFVDEAADFITSSRQILSGAAANVTYKAGDGVILTNGFLVTEGATFIGTNKPCGIAANSFTGTAQSETSLKAQREEEMAERMEREAEAKEKEGN